MIGDLVTKERRPIDLPMGLQISPLHSECNSFTWTYVHLLQVLLLSSDFGSMTLAPLTRYFITAIIHLPVLGKQEWCIRNQAV
jgi:hypothetical protein